MGKNNSVLNSFLQEIMARNDKFISIGRGLHAQQSKDTETPSSPGEHHITLAERELYREETCQYCGVVGYIAKICWNSVPFSDAAEARSSLEESEVDFMKFPLFGQGRLNTTLL